MTHETLSDRLWSGTWRIAILTIVIGTALGALGLRLGSNVVAIRGSPYMMMVVGVGWWRGYRLPP